jgi:hypothetical protein
VREILLTHIQERKISDKNRLTVKGSVSPVLVQSKEVNEPEIGKNKNRRKTADGFDIFLVRLRFFIKFNKTTILKKRRKCLKYVDTVGNRPMGSSYFLLTGDPVGNALIGSPFFGGHFLSVSITLLAFAVKVSNTLLAIFQRVYNTP